jgi:hypothetical protein
MDALVELHDLDGGLEPATPPADSDVEGPEWVPVDADEEGPELQQVL